VIYLEDGSHLTAPSIRVLAENLGLYNPASQPIYDLLFSGLSDEDLSFLCGIITRLRIAKGESFFNEGDEGEQAYVIKKGRIQIFKTVAGWEVHLALRGPGEVIGEVSLLESVPCTASGRAQEDSLLFVITLEQMDQLLGASPSAGIPLPE
jgi:CRP-like cAMP-binding protein